MSKASEWKKRSREQVAVDLVLPSGQEVKARRPSIHQLANWGAVPASLAAAMSGRKMEPADITPEEGLRVLTFTRELLLWCLVEPRVSMTPEGEDEIHPRDIQDEDLNFIVMWALRQKEAAALEGFRTERQDAGRGGNGADIRPAAVDAAGFEGPGAGAAGGHGGGGEAAGTGAGSGR